MRTVFEVFMATAQAAPEHAFLAVPPASGRAYHPDGVEFSYGRTLAEALRLRDVYAAGGYGHGHRVALLLENRPEFFFHYFVDRKKNIIRRSGENIAAAEVEATLQAHDAVAQVAVLAVADELREEEVMACVVPMAGVTADRALAEGLADWCRERLAYFKAPGWILFVPSLPTTGTQKVQIFPRGEDPRARAGAIDLRERKKRR
jgi:acyl-CoA synthetase (AMP-forming)/AMP-acid ligase II